MYSILAKILGKEVLKRAVRAVSKEAIEKYGAKVFAQFVKLVGKESIEKFTKQELFDMLKKNAAKATSKVADDEVKSYAKRFAAQVNKRIDQLEGAAKRYASKTSVSADATDLGIDMTGINDPYMQFIASRGSKTRAGARFIADTLYFPRGRVQATAGGFIRGFSGESVARVVARILDVLIQGPKAGLAAPKIRTFIRSITREIKVLRSMGDITSASKLWNALQLALKESSTLYGQPAGLLKYQIGGNVAGRTVAAGGFTFYWIGPEEKEANREKFRKSIKPFLRQTNFRVYVPPYTRSDGTKVRGHYRNIRVKPATTTTSKRVNTSAYA